MTQKLPKKNIKKMVQLQVGKSESQDERLTVALEAFGTLIDAPACGYHTQPRLATSALASDTSEPKTVAATSRIQHPQHNRLKHVQP
jgi:hypothetical protein